MSVENIVTGSAPKSHPWHYQTPGLKFINQTLILEKNSPWNLKTNLETPIHNATVQISF